jgi:hypothetical protein
LGSDGKEFLWLITQTAGQRIFSRNDAFRIQPIFPLTKWA